MSKNSEDKDNSLDFDNFVSLEYAFEHRWKVSDGFKLYRTQNGISQKEMADNLGVSLRSYQAYERGERAVPSDVIEYFLIQQADTIDVLSMLFIGRETQPSVQDKQMIVSLVLKARKFLEANFPDLNPRYYEVVIQAYINNASNLVTLDRQQLTSFAKIGSESGYFTM